MEKPKLLQSSDNPEQWSRTWQNLVPTIATLGTFFGYVIDSVDLHNAGDAAIAALFAGLTAYKSAMFAYGAWRKVANTARKR